MIPNDPKEMMKLIDDYNETINALADKAIADSTLLGYKPAQAVLLLATAAVEVAHRTNTDVDKALDIAVSAGKTLMRLQNVIDAELSE